MLILFYISVGDFIDRYTIAQIKAERIGHDFLRRDLEERYKPVFNDLIETSNSSSVMEIHNNLFEINSKLWDVEDKIRSVEKDFELADLSKTIISLNDARAFYKKKLDEVFGSLADTKRYSGNKRNYSI